MTDRVRFPLAPFRTPRLSGSQAGWLRPILAVLVALILPALLAIAFSLLGAPTIAGPPKDGSGYTLADHLAIFLVAVSASVVVSWILAPVAVIVLRAAAMLGFAGWGAAVCCALLLGLPTVHLALNGDVTTENQAILPHIIAAICLLALSVWTVFWGLTARHLKKVSRDPS